MPYSMTGFGRGEAQGSGYALTVELKAVNNRYLEVVIRLPRGFGSLEERLRKEVQNKVQRGRIEVMINIVQTEEKKRMVKVDKDLALSYDKKLKDFANILHCSYEVDLYRLVTLPEVLTVEDVEADMEALGELGSQALNLALAGFMNMRSNEGEKLALDLQQRFDDIETQVKHIDERADVVVKDYQTRLQDRIKGLLGEVALDEARLANEVAYFADRASIDEELVRLRSHLSQGRGALRLQEPVGRKLDFLLQEMNREINTIGSKANDLTIAQAVIMVKSELEKIREQIQNLE